MKEKSPGVFLLAGGASGIGVGTARLLTAQGESVMLTDIKIVGAWHVAASLCADLSATTTGRADDMIVAADGTAYVGTV